MCLRYWMLFVLLVAVAYASSAPTLPENSETEVSNQGLVRRKRFIFPTALLAGKALMSAGAWGIGLLQGAIYGGTVLPVYVHHSYPVHRPVYYYPSYGRY